RGGISGGACRGVTALQSGERGHAHANAQANINGADNVTLGGLFDLALASDAAGNSARATANLAVHGGNLVNIQGGNLRIFLSSSAASQLDSALGNLLPGADGAGVHRGPFAISRAAAALASGSGASHHANATAQVNIDPPVINIGGNVAVTAVAFDNNGIGAEANANLHLHGSEVHVGTPFGKGSAIVVA